MKFLDVTSCQIIAYALFVHLFFLFAVCKKRNDIADVAWGLGFVLVSFVGVIHNFNIKTIIVFVLVAIWGLRLGSHIYKKFSSHDEEDARYSKWRAGWGKHWKIYSYGKVFLLQGFLLLLVAMPILLISRYSSGEWSIINTIGILVWIFGFTFEVVGDRQLKSFIKSRDRNTGNQIMKKGLWKYSRHPNYFGEAVLWWGIFLIAFGVDYFYLAIIGPITIFLLLRFVSGVPMAEERYGENIEFQEYKRKTPAMFPNFFIK